MPSWTFGCAIRQVAGSEARNVATCSVVRACDLVGEHNVGQDGILLPHSFRGTGLCINGGADPLVRAGRPALPSRNHVLADDDEPARGPAAGVRPTIYAGARSWETMRH